mgnify:CR=1 FL=1
MHEVNNLIKAYQNTHYIVHDGPKDFVLRVSINSLELKALYANHNAKMAAYISAFNPYSQITSPELNTQAHTELKTICTNRNYIIYEGDGTDPCNLWKPEKSLLLVGISFSEACDLGMYFQQNAILFAGETPTPRLILL